MAYSGVVSALGRTAKGSSKKCFFCQTTGTIYTGFHAGGQLFDRTKVVPLFGITKYFFNLQSLPLQLRFVVRPMPLCLLLDLGGAPSSSS